MHYMRRRFQKGKGLLKQTQGMNDFFGVPLYAIMALTADFAHSKKKINIKTKRTPKNKKQKRRDDGLPVSD